MCIGGTITAKIVTDVRDIGWNNIRWNVKSAVISHRR